MSLESELGEATRESMQELLLWCVSHVVSRIAWCALSVIRCLACRVLHVAPRKRAAGYSSEASSLTSIGVLVLAIGMALSLAEKHRHPALLLWRFRFTSACAVRSPLSKCNGRHPLRIRQAVDGRCT